MSDVLLSIRDDIKVLSIDNNLNETVSNYIKPKLDNKYPNRHLLLYGNSNSCLKSYKEFNRSFKVDLIFIDGSIYVNDVCEDIMNCKEFSDENTLLIVNSLKPYSKGGTGRYDGWNMMVKRGIIYETGYYNNEDLTKTWGVGKYNINNLEMKKNDLTMCEEFWITNKVYINK